MVILTLINTIDNLLLLFNVMGFYFLDDMYCIQWLLPLFLLPHPIVPSIHHYLFLVLHLLTFLIEKRPCTICLLVFFTAAILFCYNCWEQCIFWPLCSYCS